MKKSEAYYAAMEAVILLDLEPEHKIEILSILMDDWKTAKLLEAPEGAAE